MSSLINNFFRFATDKTFSIIADADIPIGTQRSRLDLIAGMMPKPLGLKKEQDELAGRPTLKLTGKWTEPDGPVILYLHGGAFIIGSPRSYLSPAGFFSRAVRGTLYLLDYRLAPEQPCPAALEDCVSAYQELLDRGIDAARIVIMGDSAGGQLSLATCQQLRARGMPLPAGMGLLCPVADGTFSGSTVGNYDPILTLPWMIQGIEEYAAGRPLEDPLVSPLFGDLSGLPETLLVVSANEPLLDDSRRLRDAFATTGVTCEYLEWPDMWHVWFVMAGLGFPEARRAILQIGEWCRQRMR